ncbi:hypothetical protein SNE35_18265 [Paucibacter sp. R3-3]|uniref:Uncharacterized protein n=1 Tax=Roseateles agri TaxID=3098619 RepID=A0ABU5DL76_9BURK|nr:hypothetical protein [Paucibacter sp. R3-3]MDY0746463.1 hypothetical protein [Paucibacter sp. R3-3]
MPKIVHVGYRSPIASSMAWLHGLLAKRPRVRVVVRPGARH